MKKNLFKTFTLLAVLFVSLFFVTFSTNAFARSGMCYFASTQFGEDSSTSASFHYHSEQTNTYVKLTTSDDETFANFRKVEVESTLVDYLTPELISSQGAIDFPEKFYECAGRVTDLTPDTEYIWCVTDGTTTSAVYTFHTSAGVNKPFTFAFTTDSQNYASGGRYDTYNDWGKRIFETAKSNGTTVDFIISAGDIVENSGRGQHWELFFGPDYFQNTVFMPTPGNHDFSGLISSGSVDGRFFSSMFDNPLNGPEGQYPELCYYFKYNDALFITLSSSYVSRSAQVAWLEEVLKNNPAQYKIITCHYPMNSTATDNAREFVPIIDKYNVDLVLFGHTHTYDVQQNYYNYRKSSDPNVGTTYISASSPEGASGSVIATQLLFTFSESSIILRAYDTNSINIDILSFNAKRVPTSSTTNFNEADFVDSFEMEVEQEQRTTAKFKYSSSAYNNVYKVSLKDNTGKVIGESVVSDSVNNYINVTGLTPDTTYESTVSYEFYDGTVKEVPFTFKTNITNFGKLDKLSEKMTSKGYSLVYVPSFRPEVKSLTFYVGEKKVGEGTIEDRKILIPLAELDENKKNEIYIMAVLEDGSESLIYATSYGTDVINALAVHDLENGTEVSLTGQVSHIYGDRGCMVTDDSGSIYCYGDVSGVKLGDVVTVSGTKAYYNGAQIASPVFTVQSNEEVSYEATDIIASEFVGLENKGANYGKYVNITGTLVKSGNYINLKVSEELTINLYLSSEEIAALETLVDKKIKATIMTYNYNSNNSVFNAFLIEEKEVYTVRFLDYDDSVLGTVEVVSGADAVSIANPTRDGYVFKGWDKALTNITSDLDVKAEYEAEGAEKFTVTFKDHDGTVLGTSTVESGANATPPASPTREGYIFTGWNGTYTNITSDKELTATYEIAYTVTFKDKDGNVIATVTVQSGKGATAPTAPEIDGFKFDSWDVDFSNVTSDITVTAKYEKAGCGNAASVLFTSFILLGLIVIRRKKW